MLRSIRRLCGAGCRDMQYGAYGSFWTSEALPGALPRKQNSPQHPPYGLYPELLSGNAFTEPRDRNRYAWLYRIRPSASQRRMFEPMTHPTWVSPPFTHAMEPTQMKFASIPQPAAGTDFIGGTVTMAAHGSPASQDGLAANTYAMNASMSAGGRFICNADADTLILPQDGALEIRTELGNYHVGPLELALVPRGMVFQVNLGPGASSARGYMLENFGDQFVIPGLGPIGISGGLAHPRHFQAPHAAYEETSGDFKLVSKFLGKLFVSPLAHSPLDVVAWYGNYVPYKYDLRNFMAIGTLTYDHPDPSINVVLTSYTGVPGRANCDFVVFPPRWMVGENTFRPPWYHRNDMSELMGLIAGSYDAKAGSVFKPGDVTIHNRFTPHGPDGGAAKAATEKLDTSKPQRYEGSLAFMWESRFAWHASEYALQTLRNQDYSNCWAGIEKRFDPENKPPTNEAYPFDFKLG